MRKTSLFMASMLIACGGGGPNSSSGSGGTPEPSKCPSYKTDVVIGGADSDYTGAIATNADGSRFATIGSIGGPADLGGGLRGADDGMADGIIVLHDAAGKYIADAVFSGSADVHVLTAAFTDDGGLVAVGEFLTSIVLDKPYTSAADVDGFIVKLDANGKLVWARALGGQGSTNARLVKIQPGTGRIVVAGSFYVEIDLGGGPIMSGPNSRLFVVALEADGTYAWSTTAGGGQLYTTGLGMDAEGNMVLSGEFYDTVDFGGGPRTSAGYNDGFLWSLDKDGKWRWDTAITSPDVEHCNGVDVAADGSVYALVDIGEKAMIADGVERDFGHWVLALDPQGKYRWDRHIQSTDFMYPLTVFATPTGPIVGGESQGQFLLPDPPLDGRGDNDAFFARWSDAGELQYACLLGAAGPEYTSDIVTVGNTLALTGSFSGGTDLGGGVRMGKGKTDGFLLLLEE